MSTVSAELSQPASTDLGPSEGLSPVFPPGVAPTLATWPGVRADILRRWQFILGEPEAEAIPGESRHVRSFTLPECLAEEYLLPTSGSSWQRVVLLRPPKPLYGRSPAALVPFYNPDLMVGYDLGTLAPQDSPTIHFGRHLVQQGYVVLCGQAFPYNTVPDPGTGVTFDWWRAAAGALLQRHPRWTGMGRLIRDTKIATDFLLEQPGIDTERVLVIGHSLGGKMAFYNGCLDVRIKAIIASDFGIGFSFTNWQDPWYLGAQVKRPDLPARHHELLAAACPTAFLLLAGECDGPASWQYVNAARVVYALAGRATALGLLDHASGHRPPEAAMRRAYRWLAEQFGLPDQPYRI
jgi:hypothetical protein